MPENCSVCVCVHTCCVPTCLSPCVLSHPFDSGFISRSPKSVCPFFPFHSLPFLLYNQQVVINIPCTHLLRSYLDMNETQERLDNSEDPVTHDSMDIPEDGMDVPETVDTRYLRYPRISSTMYFVL